MSKLRILRFSTYYDKYLNQFFSRHPELKQADYDSCLAAILGDKFFYADSWKIHLEATGRFEVEEIIFNSAFFREKWAQKTGYQGKMHWKDVLEAQIAAFRPQVLWEEDTGYLTREYREYLKAQFPSVQAYISWEGYPPADPEPFRGTDLILTCAPNLAEKYRQAGIPAVQMGFYFDTTILDKLPARTNAYDFSFIGSLADFQIERRRLLLALDRALPIDLFIGNIRQGISPFNKPLLRKILQRQLGGAYALYQLQRRNHGTVWGLDMYKVLQNSVLTLNHYENPYAANRRIIEATAMGCCLLTDDKPNMHEYFETGTEVEVYSSAGEAVDKARFLLANPEAAQRIARAGREKTMRDFTYQQGVLRLEAELQKHFQL